MSSSEGYELGTADTLEEVMERRTNQFDSLNTEQLVTQWAHKVSSVPEEADAGGSEVPITTKWWTYTSGVVRDGSVARIPAGENIRTDQSGNYVVGVPALAGGALRVEGTPVENGGDDWWAGYGTRLTQSATDADGAGVGYAYFTDGEGDLGGADGAGDQEYVWFKSGLPDVDDVRVPRDQWNGELEEMIASGALGDVDLSKGELFIRGGFIRVDYTFYNEGSVDINYGVKTGDQTLVIANLHSFAFPKSEMWSIADLNWEMAVEGSGNVTGYIAAAHYRAGDPPRLVRFGGEARDGTVFGAGVTVNQGDSIPLISLQKRPQFQGVSLSPLSFSVSMDSSFYVFIAVDTGLTGANFTEPNSEFTDLDREDSEYAVFSDNEATDVSSIGDLEVLNFVPDSGDKSPAEATGNAIDLALENDEIVTMGIIPLDATILEGSSFSWGTDF